MLCFTGQCTLRQLQTRPVWPKTTVREGSESRVQLVYRRSWNLVKIFSRSKKERAVREAAIFAGDCKFKPAIYSTVHFTTCLKSTAKCTHASSVFTSLCSADRKAVKSLTKQCFAAIVHNVVAARAATSCNFTEILFIPKENIGSNVIYCKCRWFERR